MVLVFALLMAGSCGYALLRGDPSAKVVATTVILGSLLSAVLIEQTSELWQGSEPGIFVIDGIMLVIFVAIMIKSDRFWPIWTTAAQLLSVLAHIGPLLRHAHIAVPFAVGEQLWSWFILAQLAYVTWQRYPCATAPTTAG